MSDRATSLDELATFVERPAFRLLSIDNLAALPEPSWLVERWLPDRGASVLYGASGSYKSFLALDWALCIASGVPWYGHEVKQGHVVYLALEGGFGLHKRIAAWMAERPAADPSRHFHAIIDPVNLADHDAADAHAIAEAISDTIDGQPVVLVVVDTLARAMPTGDENSPRDVGAFIAATDFIIRRFDCASLTLHHTGHSETKRERGHSSLPAAADCRLQVRRDGDKLVLEQPKVKDFAPTDGVRLQPRGVRWCACGGGNCEVHDSLVLDWVGQLPSSDAVKEQAVREKILAFLRDNPDAPTEAVRTNVEGMQTDKIKALLNRMVDEGEVERWEEGRTRRHRLPDRRLPGTD